MVGNCYLIVSVIGGEGEEGNKGSCDGRCDFAIFK